jgi:ketosteroid isomerase-like protein
MTEQENVQLVQELDAAFGRGDVPAILEQSTDDVVWHDPRPPEVPHAGRYVGTEEVGRFFARTEETSQIDEFAPTEFRAQTDRVVIIGSLHARVKDTGRSYDSEWAMIWTLRDAKWQAGKSTRTPLASLRPIARSRPRPVLLGCTRPSARL